MADIASESASGKQARARLREADRDLAVENFPELNREFYRVEPHEYFNHRLSLLLLAMGKPQELRSLIDAGIKVDRLTVGGPSSDKQETDRSDDYEELEEKRLAQFAVAESAVLLHHVSETLLRFYLAHESMPPCPWLEIARVRFDAFKKQIAERFDGSSPDAGRKELLARVFYGQAGPPDGPSEFEWSQSLENIEAWLIHYARWFLDESNLYNAAKHGLAVQGGETSMKLDAGDLIGASGPSLSYIEEWRATPAARRRWHRTTRWLQPDSAAAEIFLATQMIQSIWLIGRARYVEPPKLPARMRFYLEPKYEDFARKASPSGEGGLIVNTMRWNLLYYDRTESADESSEGALREAPPPL
jgi:hypothetical protein